MVTLNHELVDEVCKGETKIIRFMYTIYVFRLQSFELWAKNFAYTHTWVMISSQCVVSYSFRLINLKLQSIRDCLFSFFSYSRKRKDNRLGFRYPFHLHLSSFSLVYAHWPARWGHIKIRIWPNQSNMHTCMKVNCVQICWSHVKSRQDPMHWTQILILLEKKYWTCQCSTKKD